ncbi:MAG: nicotinamide-nucleotide amidohydrolase family protein [Synergistaceae bacterium]|jgi:nicotinamide-nucleotide amidase|nr:nicotinamide-nucleotide amidohydrolase family protein [Synergistaceae bacterium]
MKEMKERTKTAVLAAVGDELLSGLRNEGNCAFLARLLHDEGWTVERVEIVPDDPARVADVLSRWVGKVDLLVMSGGLGPTHDDRTRCALAEFLGCGLAVDNALYDRVAARYRGTEREALVERSRSVQGLVPEAAQGVYNPAGSALGVRFERSGTRVWSFPGVPFEFEAMTRQELTPLLTRGRDASYAWDSAAVAGVPESVLVERVPDIIADSRLRISVLPSFGLVEFVVRGERALVGASMKTLRARLPDDVLPEGCTTLPQAILKTGLEKGLTLSCAESCTGGMAGAALTDVPGSSGVFMGSAVVYSNEAKEKLLGVERSVLEKRGAVSGECAEAMARGALALYGTSIAVAVTGIAGPGGGAPDSENPEKSVGTVWFAVASRTGGGIENERIECRSFVRRLGEERALVRERAVRTALTAAWRQMKEM